MIDQDLKFHEHTSFATNKANRVLGLIKKSFSYLNSDMLVHLYKSMVRPILEYGNIIWGPHYLMDQKKVEKIQRRATKLITGLHDSNYATRLMELRLPSLNYRRQRGDMILLYQIFNHMVDIDINNFFVLSSGITRGHELKLYKCRSSCPLRSNFFSHRVVNTWNSLPQHLIKTCSLNDFKTKLDRHWTDIMYYFIV